MSISLNIELEIMKNKKNMNSKLLDRGQTKKKLYKI